MSQPDNSVLVRRVIEEVWNGGTYDSLDDVVAPNIVIHLSSPDEDIRGSDHVAQSYSALRAAFPDLHFTVDDQIAASDRVVTRWTANGAHDGEFQGIPPTGARVTWTGIEIDRLAGGKIVECWAQVDQLGLLRHLGAFPAPAAP